MPPQVILVTALLWLGPPLTIPLTAQDLPRALPSGSLEDMGLHSQSQGWDLQEPSCFSPPETLPPLLALQLSEPALSKELSPPEDPLCPGIHLRSPHWALVHSLGNTVCSAEGLGMWKAGPGLSTGRQAPQFSMPTADTCFPKASRGCTAGEGRRWHRRSCGPRGSCAHPSPGGAGWVLVGEARH